MKKNLIFGISLVLVVLIASSVFAGLFGITGNALRTGERIAQDSSLTIKGIEDNKVSIGEDTYSEGETFSDSGKTYEVKAIEEKAWFFGSDKVVIEEVEEPVEVCADSDDGLNYYEKGKTGKDGWESIEDFCVDKTLLSEALCNKDGNPAYAKYECPNGCVDGACFGEKPVVESEVIYEGILKMLSLAEPTGDYLIYKGSNVQEVRGIDICEPSFCLFGMASIINGDTVKRNLISCDKLYSYKNLASSSDWEEGTMASFEYMCASAP